MGKAHAGVRRVRRVKTPPPRWPALRESAPKLCLVAAALRSEDL